MTTLRPMTESELQCLREDRRANRCTIKLGTGFAHAIGNGNSDLTPLARERMDRISRGERTVDVYRNGKIAERLIATRDQVAKLVAWGATPAAVDVEESELADAAEENAES